MSLLLVKFDFRSINFDLLQVDSYCLLTLVDKGSIEDQPR